MPLTGTVSSKVFYHQLYSQSSTVRKYAKCPSSPRSAAAIPGRHPSAERIINGGINPGGLRTGFVGSVGGLAQRANLFSRSLENVALSRRYCRCRALRPARARKYQLVEAIDCVNGARSSD